MKKDSIVQRICFLIYGVVFFMKDQSFIDRCFKLLFLAMVIYWFWKFIVIIVYTNQVVL